MQIKHYLKENLQLLLKIILSKERLSYFDFIGVNFLAITDFDKVDGTIQEIQYAVIYGKMPGETDPDFRQIKPILDKSYKLIFQNDFCWLYRLRKH